MYSIKNIDGKESNMAKGVSIATEFNEFKETLFNKKMLRHKMRRKLHKIGTYEMDKKIIICFWWQKICFRWWYSYACLFS